MVKGNRKRKYAKRTRKTLSKYNIYAHKSASSQSRQIYALKKKIDRVSKLCSPDIVNTLAYGYKMFSNQDLALSSTYMMFMYIPGSTPFYNQDSWQGSYPPSPGDTTFNVVGGYYRINCIYSNNYTGTTDIGQCERHANVRVILLRRKSSFNPNPTSTNPASYLAGYSGSGQDYLMNHILGFREGTATEVEILYDKWKNINEQKPQCSFDVKIPKLIMKYMNNVTYPQNALYGFICVDGLTMGGVSHTSLVANVNCAVVARMCYTATSVDAT